MRSLLLAILVAGAGCHGAKPAAAAWPAPSKTADDGGESIEPKPTSVAAVIEKSAVTDDAGNKTDSASKPAAGSDDKPASGSAKPTDSTEPVMLDDEIIIEVDD